MSIQNKDTFSEVIDITLYKYNSIDLKIWGLLNRYYSFKRLYNNSVLISADAFKNIINNYFHDDLNKIKSIGKNLIHKEATTIYFINKVFDTMPNVKWFKVNLNKNMQYSRIVDVDQTKTISFNVKTIRGSFRLFDYFNIYQIKELNKLFTKMGIFKSDEYFKVIKAQDLLYTIDNFLNINNNTNNTIVLLNTVIQHLEEYEIDNPEILLITDIESDI